MTDQSGQSPRFKFRNYEPQTGALEGLYTLRRSELSEPTLISSLVQDKLDLLEDDADDNNRYRVHPKFLDPKKSDWDLKRRIEPRLEKLERVTRRQIDRYRSSKPKKLSNDSQ